MTETIHRAQVGRRLRAAIDVLGHSQTDVAKTLGVSPSKLGNWIRGDNYPSEWFVKRFCDRYGITTDWLYRGVVSGMDTNLADALWKSAQTPSPDTPPKPHPKRKAKPTPNERAPPKRPFKGGNVARNPAKPDCDANVAKRRVVRLVEAEQR